MVRWYEWLACGLVIGGLLWVFNAEASTIECTTDTDCVTKAAELCREGESYWCAVLCDEGHIGYCAEEV
jgi:hypothetical protein